MQECFRIMNRMAALRLTYSDFNLLGNAFHKFIYILVGIIIKVHF